MIDYQLGNLLADPLKGKGWQGCSSLVLDGIKMHGHIDAFTDANEFVRKSKSRLGDKGHLKGVVVDIAYDYCLLKNWDEYVTISAQSFITEFYREAEQEVAQYPGEIRRFVERIIEHNVLSSYASIDGVSVALMRIDSRLSERILAKETSSSYLSRLESQIDAIEEDFRMFFPQLVSHFKLKSGFLTQDHWLIEG